MGTDYTVAHAAVLASQLPRESRTMCAYDPDLAWSNEMAALVRIDYMLQGLILGRKKGGRKPQMIQTPSERKAFEDKFDGIESEMADIARLLGIEGD